MSKIVLLFGYIHYRIYLFFKERGDNIPVTTATLLLSLMQFLTVIDIMFAIQLIRDFPTPSKFAFLPLLIGCGIMNWFLHERNFDAEKIEIQWKEERKEDRTRNGWLIGVYLLVSFFFPVTLGILEHNLKVI